MTTPSATAAILILGLTAPEPDFVNPQDLTLTSQTVAICTHASTLFDPLRLCKPALDRTVVGFKRLGLPILYFHDKYNAKNPAWRYYYRDREPTAYVASDIGEYDIDSTHVRHVVSLGGYFWCCQRNTIRDAIRLWRRDAPDADFRVTQVVDAVFDVAEGVRFEDDYRKRVRDYYYGCLRTENLDASIPVDEILTLIDDEEQIREFLERQFVSLPSDVNIHVDLFGRRYAFRLAEDPEKRPTLTLAYRRANELVAELAREAYSLP